MILPNSPNFPSVHAPEWFIGLDIGQRRDYSAVVVLDYAEEVTTERDPATYQFIRRPAIRLRHAERVHLGTPFHAVVNRVAQILGHPQIRDASLIVDANGVGAPVVELIRTASLPCRLVPVQTTSGGMESADGSFHRVPKRDLVTGLQILFARWPFTIAAQAPAAGALIRELVEFKAKTGTSGALKFEGSRHDDLIMALALAWWWMRKRVAWKLPPALSP